MKASKRIIASALSVSLCAAAWANAAANQPPDLTFGKYYEPYKLNVEPNVPSYTMPLDINDIVNFKQVRSALNLTNVQEHLIEQNGFVVIEYDFGARRQHYREDIVLPYSYLRKDLDGIPIFITTDTALFLYHVQFDQTLRDIEESEFVRDIKDLTEALLRDSLSQYSQFDGDLKEAAKRNVACLSVAERLIDPNAPLPEFVDDIARRELTKIEAHRGFGTSEIFAYPEDYSQYVPRGHYTRSEQLKRYFKTMMWYGRMAFLLKGGPGALVSEHDARIQTLQAFLLATSLKKIRVGERSGLDIWDRLYTVTAFYTGLADDLTPYDYLWALDQVFGAGFVLGNLTDVNNLLALKTKLALLPSPKIYGGTGNVVVTGPITKESLNEILDKTKGMRMMGQRFVPDSHIFQHLVFPEVGDYRGDSKNLPFTAGSTGMGGLSRMYVRGLDVMAALGSHEALRILINERDADYERFWQRFGELKDQFVALSPNDWNRTLYWSWLYTLRALLDEVPDGYPNFMCTEAWQRRQLHAALASWTQLRHDTILYTKPSGAAGGIGPPLEVPPPGYVEPVAIFWGRLMALTRMTSQGLGELGVLSPQASSRLKRLEDLLRQALEITAKQLTNRQLSSEDHEWIKDFPQTLKWIVVGMGVQDLKTTLVADVHTDFVKAKTIEEAVGKLDLIVVACPMPDGKAFLAVGPVLSYYEFKHPMNDRLTDEAWRQLLDSPKKPQRPGWYVPLMGAVPANLP